MAFTKLNMLVFALSQDWVERGGKEERAVERLGQEMFPKRLIVRRARGVLKEAE
jgi:hypothetical protein